jgi:hypothetical protein
MKYIKLFENYIVDENFFENIDDILVELRDDGLFTKVYTYDYKIDWLEKHSKNLLYFYKGQRGSLADFIKEECTLLTIYIGKDSDDFDTEFIFKEDYSVCFKMVDDYIKEFYNLEYDDIFYIENNSTIHKGDWLDRLDGKKVTDLRVNYILPIGSLKSSNRRYH